MRWIFIFAISIPAVSFARTYHLGLHAVSFDYREDLAAPLRSRETGWMPFLEAGLAFQPSSLSFLRGGLISTVQSRTRYEGSSLATLQPIEAEDTHSMHHLEIAAGKSDGDLTAYAGLSYDQWNRFLAYGSQYREVYRWWTLPAGLIYPLSAGRGWSVDGAFLIMLRGDIDVIFSETIKGGQDTTLTLGNRVGWRIRFPYDFSWNDREWTLTPWVQATSFGASEMESNSTPGLGGRVGEPASQTLQTGLGLRVNQAF